jgi:Carboxypeptidase regulatory-like domain
VNVRKWSRLAAFFSLLLIAGQPLLAQGVFATLTGVVSDPAGAVVPNAKITLTDAVSGSARETTADGDGYYTFASVPVGSYNLSVASAGFKDYTASGIALGGGEKRNVNIALSVGTADQTVSVNAETIALATTDSGERSFSLGTKELENFTQVGSNAAEYIKIVPGFGVQNGTSNKSNYNGATIGINANGDSGSQSPLNSAYSYNGLPNNSLDIVADGAHVSDPGCNCDTPVNPNSDFLQEFKVLTSNFSAEDQKGPILITSVTKAGGTSYHGSAFFTARNYVLNANDWLNNFSGVKQPADKYYYPGGTIGGPIFIPGTRFHKDNTKLFFWTGFEYYYQVLDTGLLRATVPTAGELNGDFSPEEVAKEGTITASGKAPGQLTTGAMTAFGGTTINPCSGPANGSCIDPNQLALAKLFPAVNANPNSTGGYNYVQSEIFNQNNRQWTIRGDYNISEATKVFVRYNYQREVQQFPVGLWWRNGDQVPYPTAIEGKNKSDSWSGSITHVFNATMTNETVIAYTFVGFPNVFADPAKVARSNVGYSYKGLFNNGVSQIPSFGNFGPSEAALVFNPGGFEAGGASEGLYANKWMPSVSDTFTKVMGDHTIKAGIFYEWIRNSQPANNNTNGEQLVSASSNSFSYGNEYADLLTGNLNSYNETNKNRINDIAYGTYEFFVQDSWKATRKLTVELGVRFSHFQPWEDRLGFGYSIFAPSQYAQACAGSPTFCGFEWHAKDSSVPVGGFPTRALFYQPRFGAAYDVTGTGRTVIRGGWGQFVYHSGQFTSGLDASAGVATANLSPSTWVGSAGCPTNPSTGSALFTSYLSCLNLSATPASPSAVSSNDDKQPYTQSWSLNLDQQTPFQGLMEISYVGNRSEDLQNTEGGFGSNINLVAPGALFAAPNPATANANNYRHYLGYGDLVEATNNLYSNYNAMQVSWIRHAGKYTIQSNYTWQKAMGIVNPANNPFSIGANYGPLSSDRRNLFNAAYSVDFGTIVHSNHLVNGVANGWQLSGITQLESGANLTYGGNNTPNNPPNLNFNAAYTCVATAAEKTAGISCPQSAAIIPGSVSLLNPTGIAINNQSILGTSSQTLNPLVTCNPLGHQGPHSYVNGNCFAAPTVPGQAGPNLLPAAYGPAFFDSDLSVFKNFAIRESMKLQIRAMAYNFLNHPLYSFPGGNQLNLQFEQDPVSQVITQSNTGFGAATQKQGARVVEFGAKFYF